MLLRLLKQAYAKSIAPPFMENHKVPLPRGVASFNGEGANVQQRNYVKPKFALWNKDYGEPPFGSEPIRVQLVQLLEQLTELLGANAPGTGAVLADDMLVWFRNAAYLSDPEFIAALGPHFSDPTLRARIWRVYTLCWAARSCLSLSGDFVDVGCYDGKTVSVVQRYCRFTEHHEKTYWMYDIFEDPPGESRKAGHGPQLFDTVRNAFEPLGNFRVIKGSVPAAFTQGLPQKIAFAQIDLNVAEAEIGALEVMYDRLVPGAMIVFDDFGFRRYRESQRAEAAFFAAMGELVWESPTGQGLFIKR